MLPSKENKARGTTENSYFERLPLRSISCLERATVSIRANNPRSSFSSVTVSLTLTLTRFDAVLNILSYVFSLEPKNLQSLT